MQAGLQVHYSFDEGSGQALVDQSGNGNDGTLGSTAGADTNDPYIPLLLWWAIESKCQGDAAEVVSLFREQDVWSREIVREHILERLMRRFAQAGTRKDLLVCA